MRWSSVMAALLLAAGCVLLLQPNAYSADSDAWRTGVVAEQPPSPPSSFEAFRATLTPDDPVAVLEAISVVLDEVSDGATYRWHRTDGSLRGTVRPTSSFRTADGEICRRLDLTLTLTGISRSASVTACRNFGGRWSLNG